MTKLFETYKLSIRPLTPIHVGSGEEISPGEYFILDDNSGNPELYAVDIDYLASRLKEEPRRVILRWLDANPIRWVKTAVDSKRFPELVRKYSSFQCEVTDRVAANIGARWGKDDSNLSIRTLQRPVKDAILPGSSIKGAIRTALLYAAVRKPLDRPPDRASEIAGWERTQLGGRSGNIFDDPLRHLSIGDAVVSGLKTVIYDAEFYGMKTQSGDQADLQVYCECFPETLDGEDKYCFETTLTIASGHPAYSSNARRIRAGSILESCREFYGEVVEAELSYWKHQADREMVLLYQNLQDWRAGGSNTALIRLGWGSGMDSVGLNLARPKGSRPVRAGDTRFRYEPTTRRLLNSWPPGWAEIRLEKC